MATGSRCTPEPPTLENIEAVRAKGGITSQGRLEGFVPVAYSGTDIAAAMEGAEIVFVVGPAFATEPFGRDLAPHLRTGMTVVICPGSCGGALAFKRAAGLAVHDDSVIVGETSTLPYACRADGQGNVHVFHKFDTGLFASAVPRSGNGKLLETLRQVYPSTIEAATVFQTSLQNGNPVIHPAVTLMNAGLLERTGGDFLFYEEGVTPASGRLMEAVDTERLAIATALGVTILSEPEIGVEQGYMTESNYTTGYSARPASAASRHRPASTRGTSPKTSATPWSSSPTWHSDSQCPRRRWTRSSRSPLSSSRATCVRKEPARCARWHWTG